MIYRTTDIRTLVAKLYRDLRLTSTEYDLDFVEWIGEALSHIGAYPQLARREAILDVESNRAALPVSLVQLLAVAYAPDEESDDLLELTKRLLPLSGASFHAGVHTGSFQESDLQEETFTLTPGYIHTSFETGTLVISFLGYPLGEDGYPLVPDDPSFFDACKWYCATRLLEGGWQHPAGLGFEDCETRWLKYCSQARTKAITPDMPQMERFMENWVRLYPDHDAPYNHFSRDTSFNDTPFGTDHIDLS